MSDNKAAVSEFEAAVDLETLDTVGSKKQMPIILSIGAILFDPKVVNSEDEFVGDMEKFRANVQSGLGFADYSKYYSPVSLMQSLRHGFTHSEDTVKWWEKQPVNLVAQAAAHTDKLVETLEDFAKWLKYAKPKKVWANAPSFDLRILRETFEHMGVKCEIDFRSERDVRTANDFAGIPRHIMSAEFPKHNALCDAIWAASSVQRMYAKRRYYEALEIENAGLKDRIAELVKQLAQTTNRVGSTCED